MLLGGGFCSTLDLGQMEAWPVCTCNIWTVSATAAAGQRSQQNCLLPPHKHQVIHSAAVPHPLVRVVSRVHLSVAGPENAKEHVVGEHMFLTRQDHTLADVKVIVNVHKAREGNREAPGPPSPHLSGRTTMCSGRCSELLMWTHQEVWFP